MRMPLMERYIFRRVASAFFLALTVLVGTLWLTQALKELDVVTAKGQTIWIFLMITGLAMPALLQIIAPIAFLIAAVFVLNGLNSDGELAAMAASGASRSTVGRPIFALAILVTTGVWLLYNLVSPISLSGLRLLIIQVRADLIATLVKDGGFRTMEDGLTIHIREKAPDGRFLGIFLSDDRDPKESLQYLAKTGVLLENDQGAFLVMTDGDLVRQETGAQSKNVVAFEKYAFDLSQFTNAGHTPLIKPRERATLGLLDVPVDDPYRKKSPNRFAAEFHLRMASPFYPLAFTPVLLAFLGRPRTNRQDRGFASAAAVIICTGLFGAGFAAVAAVNSSVSFIPVLYALPLGGFVAGYLALVSNARLRMPKIAERIVDAVMKVVRNIADSFGSGEPGKGSPV